MIGPVLQQIGWVNLLWNKVEQLWFLVYQENTPDGSRLQLDAVFKQFDTGRRQRQAILAALSADTDQDETRLLLARSLIDRTNAAAETRNALMHADFHLGLEANDWSLHVSHGHGRKANRLSQKDLEAELQNLVTTLKVLFTDIETQLLPPFPGIPGVAESLTTARFVELIEQLIAAEAGRRP
ncbi:MAG: hypothetical protein Q7J82_08525 [Coriobacteriia bacterium]|nr:hypothetical protein [Coriobacteriia bacterium]